MNIRRLLTLIIAIVILTSIASSSSIYFAFGRHQVALEKANFINEIYTDVFRRRLVSDDYILNQVIRAKSQWFTLQSEIENSLNSHENDFHTNEEKTLFAVIKNSLKNTRDTFEQIVSLDQLGDIEKDKNLNDKRIIFANQLSINTQETVSATSDLQDINRNQADVSLRQSFMILVTATLIFFILLVIAFWIIWRNTNKLQSKEAEDEAILGSIGDGVFAIDIAGKIVLFNHSAELISGYSKAEAIGQDYSKIIKLYDESNGSLVDGFIKSALQGEKDKMPARTILKRRNGDSIPVADSVAPIMSEGGYISGAVVVFRDITNERELERIKDEFVSIASHELRTPLTAIRSFISMMLSNYYGPVNEELNEPLGDIKTATLRLINLVNDLLDMSRIEAGRLKFELSDFDIKDALDQIVKSLSPLAMDKKISLSVSSIEKSVLVQADINKVKQVLTNLIGNSLKFTEKGSINLDFESQDGAVEVRVSDTGVGISKKDQDKVFGKFEQILTSQKTKPIGTGLGLYISREIIRKMGGELWVKSSNPDKGSVFAFTLVKAKTPEATKIKKALAEEEKAHEAQKISG